METKDLMYIVKKSHLPPQDELEMLHKLRADLDKWADSRALVTVCVYVAGKAMGVRQERQRRRNRRRDKARDDQLRLLQEENELLRQRVAQLRQSVEAPEELHSAHNSVTRWFDR